MTQDDERPVWVPVKAVWYEAFADGSKTEELRPYGARWNERVCRVGRAVVISCGYGTQRRLRGVITGFRIVGLDTHPQLAAVFPNCQQFAAIAVKLPGRRSRKKPFVPA